MSYRRTTRKIVNGKIVEETVDIVEDDSSVYYGKEELDEVWSEFDAAFDQMNKTFFKMSNTFKKLFK